VSDTLIAPGTPVPDFALKTEDLEDFTAEDLKKGRTSVLVFYPAAFSPTCTDQLQIYEEVVDELRERSVDVYGISCDGPFALKAFREKLGVSIPQLSDFEPKGEMSKALGAYFAPAGFPNRAIVIVDGEGVVSWSHLADSPGDLPGVNVIMDGLAASAA
jgi:peroxiredoxin (alkyl hydroperoxide reductase subunit C)